MTLIYLVIMAMLCIRVTIVFYRRFWDHGLNAEVLFSQHEVEEGGRLYLREKVENRKWLPLPTLMVKIEMDRNILCVDATLTSVTDRQYRNDWVAAMPYKRVTRSIEIIGTKRGYYNIDEVRLATTDILFRERLNKTISNHTELYVYPSRSKFMRLPEIFCRMHGESLLNRQMQEDSMEFMGIRDYVQSDSMRKINWKATARTGELKVNQYHDSSSQRLTIFLNVSQTGILRYYDLIEESIRICRNVIEEFVQKGIPVRIISNGVDKVTGQEIFIREGAGLSHIDACLKELARMDVHASARKMAELFREHSTKQTNHISDGEVSLLISAEQNAELGEAYLDFVGETGSANWLIPIHDATKEYLTEHVSAETLRGSNGKCIHAEYLVMEELGQ